MVDSRKGPLPSCSRSRETTQARDEVSVFSPLQFLRTSSVQKSSSVSHICFQD